MITHYSRMGVLVLLILMIQGTIDFKRKRNHTQPKTENENNRDLVDVIGAFIKQNIRRTTASATNPELRTSPVAADILYHQTTQNTVQEEFQSGLYIQTATIQSESLRTLPLAQITKNLKGAVTEATETEWTLVTNTLPPYCYDEYSRQLTLTLNPAVAQLTVIFKADHTPAAQHVKWKPRRSTAPPSTLVTLGVTYTDLRSIHLGHLALVRTLDIEGISVPAAATTITLPTTVGVLRLRSPFTPQPSPWGITVTPTATLVGELTIRGGTMANGPLPESQSLRFIHVHHLHKIQWPNTPINRIAVFGGSWVGPFPLSTVPVVERLEFTELKKIPPAELRRVEFPRAVGTLSLGRGADRLARYLTPARFAHTVTEILVEVTDGERFVFQDEIYVNLCRAILQENGVPDTVANCSDRMQQIVVDSYVEMMMRTLWNQDSSWAFINVPELIEYSTNALVDFEILSSSEEGHIYNNDVGDETTLHPNSDEEQEQIEFD